MASKPISDLSAFASLTLEGNLISPAMIASVHEHTGSEQAPGDYDIPRGLTLRDEITRFFRIGERHFEDFAKNENASIGATTRFAEAFLRETFGFNDIVQGALPLALSAGKGRVPIVVTPRQDELDKSSEALSTDRRRSAAIALQDHLNANDEAMWGIAINGRAIRLMRDNASLTRPTFIEADLVQIFQNKDVASFTVLWLLIHRSRFGRSGAGAADCPLEHWREQGGKEGEAARNKLAGQVQNALLALGNGLIAENKDLQEKILNSKFDYVPFFNDLLRVVYRLIFLMVAEDRDLLHPPKADPKSRKLYSMGYSLAQMRERSVRRSAFDRHHDRWEGMKIVFQKLGVGEQKLALPALGGLFESALPTSVSGKLSNHNFMMAIRELGWLKSESGVLVPINWRVMETEELGSVYESLLELQPQAALNGLGLQFAGESAEKKGNQRKTTGSYYTPNSLVQALLDTALDPVLDKTEAEADDPARALLKLSVIDPACGSGHFLLAAARRIATRLARIRAHGTPSFADFRHALRDVARSCLHGVDRNPMAVELTKVALWIETVDPGLPLGFFDAQIRCGDALLGVFDLNVLQDGIPDAAYKPLTGDDKDTAKYYLQANRAATSGQGGFDFGKGRVAMPEMKPMALDFSGFRDLPEDTVEQIEAKSARFRELRKGQAFVRATAAAHLYVAAFLLPKVGGAPAGASARMVPTTEELWMALNQGKIRQSMLDAPKAAHRARAFHWPLEFPHVMQRGGFDVILGNPPWERVKLQEEEFFALRNQEIATAKNAAARKKLISNLEKTNPRLLQDWHDALRSAATESSFMRESGRFPLGGVGDVNTYAVFTDLAWRALHPLGRAGLIIPNGLVVGFTYREFLRQLLSEKSLVSFFGFENEDKIFKDVHNETKFGLLTLGGKDIKIDEPWFTAHIRQPTEITDPEKRYALTVDEIRAINPNTLNLPAFRWSKDADVTAAIHTAAPILIEKEGKKILRNDWGLCLNTMFHMANDSGHFIEHEIVAPFIKQRHGALAVLDDGRRVYPLYEGKMLWHFDHRYGTYENQTEKQANKGVLPRVADGQHASAEYSIQPRYWVDAGLTEGAIGETVKSEWFFSWRDVGPSERTFVGTIIPKLAMGHASPYFFSENSPEEVLALSSILSSLVVDYAARQKSSRMTFFVIEQLPMLTKERLKESPGWLGEETAGWINKRAVELFYTNWELKCLADSLGLEIPPFKWIPARRAALQAEIDAAVMHLYGLTKNQAEWILDSFTVLRKYEERNHEDFRTRRLVLAAYDAMAEANNLGVAYSSPLNPPPADPSLCHPAIVSVSVSEAAE